MDFSFTKSQEEFRIEVRDFLVHEKKRLLKKGLKGTEYSDEFFLGIAKKGLLATIFPEEYGGGHRSSILYSTILMQELIREAPLDAWMPIMLLCITSPPIIKYGSRQLKDRLIPILINGKAKICLGATEPEAGSDIGNLSTKAILATDRWIINGVKIYNDAHASDCMLLSACTNDKTPKQDGISLFIWENIRNTSTATILPIWTLWEHQRSQVFFDNLEIPEENVVGETNRGWFYLKTALQPREWLEAANNYIVQTEETLEIIKDYLTRKPNKHSMIIGGSSALQNMITKLSTEINVGRLHYYYALNLYDLFQKDIIEGKLASSKEMPLAAATALAKLVTSQLYERVCDLMINVAGYYGLLEFTNRNKEWLVMRGRPSLYFRFAPSLTIAGWTTEIQKERIAEELWHF